MVHRHINNGSCTPTRVSVGVSADGCRCLRNSGCLHQISTAAFRYGTGI